MDNKHKLDLSSLDPSRDEHRWASLVNAAASKAFAARKRQVSIAYQALAWARPALAIAAGLALVSWASSFASNRAQTPSASTTQPAYVVAQWEQSDKAPSTTQILQVLGAQDGVP
jgi:beta-lactamase regulating signal transducer with metallopeptidase domain